MSGGDRSSAGGGGGGRGEGRDRIKGKKYESAVVIRNVLFV